MKMKKYLITAVLAVAISGAFVSCSDDVSYDSLIEQKAKTFEQTFIEAYGTPAPNHTWGFKKNNITKGDAITRTAYTNSNMWASDGYSVPADITDREREVVMNWFRTNENPRSETVDLHNYFIQNVGYTDHTYHAYYQKDGRTETVTITNPGTSNMDYIFVGPGYYLNDWEGMTEPAPITWDNGDDHVNNFNANSGQIQYMKYSGSEWFGFHDSYGTGSSTQGHGDNGKYCAKNRNFVIRYIDVDGVVGCYVGFNYESGKTSEGWHLDPDGFFDDRVIKLVPGEGFEDWEEVVVREEVVEVGRVFCEDLGASTLSDVDYNDVVFDAVIIHEQKTIDGTTVSDGYYAKVCLLAAGGTIPVTVGGYEVHSVLGENKVGTQVMINTLKEEERGKVNGAAVWEHAPVVIDRIDGVSSIDAIEINALYNNKVVEVTNNGEYLAPYKICVPIGTPWAKERVEIGKAYKSFEVYCSKPEVKFWEGETGENCLWESTQSPFKDYKEGDVYTNTEYRKIIWRNSGYGAVDWDNNATKSLYRFGYQKSNFSNSECITTFPETVWNQIKSGTFYLVVEGTNPCIRVTNGWWDVQWQSDFTPVNGLINNGNGTWTLAINLAGSDLVNTIDQKHLLFTGTRFTPVKLYYIP